MNALESRVRAALAPAFLVGLASCFSGSLPSIPCTASSGCPTAQSCDGHSLQCTPTPSSSACQPDEVLCGSVCVATSCPSAPEMPVVTAPAFVTASAAGYTASVPAATGLTYAWSITNGTITAGSGTAQITFTAGASGAVQLSCVLTNIIGEASPAGTATSTIVSTPATPTISAPTYATADAIGYQANVAAIPGATYAWTITNGEITSGASSDLITFTPGEIGALKLECVVTNQAGTASGTASATVEVVSAPLTPVISGPPEVSPGETENSAQIDPPADGTIAWTIDNGTITSATDTSHIYFTAGPSGAVELTCVVTNSAGTQSTPATFSTLISALPQQPAITAPAYVTANQAGYTASVAPQGDDTYVWTIANGAIIGADTGTTITFTAGASGSVQVSCTVMNRIGDTSPAGTATSAIVPLPQEPVITAPDSVTANLAGYTASVPAQALSTYAWTISGGAITAGAGTNAVTFTPGAAGTVQLTCVVTSAAGAATGVAMSSSAIVAAAATPVITAPAAVTSGQAGYSASVSQQAGVTYAWSITNGTITAGAGTNTITFTAGASGAVQLGCVGTNAVGTPSAAGSATSTIVAAPSTPVITVPAYVTANATYTASVSAQGDGSTYAWSVSGATITGSNGSATLTFTPGSSGSVQLSCTVTNAAGTVSGAGNATSAIVAAPVTPIITAPAYVTALTSYSASVPAQATGSSYAWTVTGATVTSGNGSPTIAFTAGSAGSVQYTCVVTNAANTASGQGSATSTIVAAPATPVISAPAYVTALGSYTASVPAQGAGSTYAWTVTGASITSSNGNPTITFTAGSSGSIQFGCTVTNAANTASGQATATSAILPAPATPVIAVPSVLTANQGGYTASVAAQPDSTYAWTINGGTINGSTSTSSITFATGGAGSLVLTCVVTNLAGSTSSATSTSSIVIAPATPVITAPAYVTANVAGYTASVPSQPNISYAWTISGGNITGGTNSNSITFTPTAAPPASVQLTCVVTNSAGTPSSPASVTIPIVAAPSAPVITAPAYVTASQGGYSASVPAGSSSYTWTISNGVINGVSNANTVMFTAGAAGSVVLTCVVTNAAGTQSPQASASSIIVAAPSTTTITAPTYVTANQPGYTASVQPQGAGSSYAWTVTGGSITLGQNSASITFTPGNGNTVSYTCVVSNAAGTAANTASASSIVVAPPQNPTFSSPPSYVTAGQSGYTASVTAQANVTYSWSATGAVITSATTNNTVTFTAGASGSVALVCTVTNAAGTQSAPETLTIPIVPAPAAVSIVAPASVTIGQGNYTASVTAQANSSYLWSISSGSISSGANSNSIVFSAAAPGPVVLGCTVSNQANSSSSATVSIPVVAAPATPVIMLSSQYVTAGLSGYTASVAAQSNVTYTWGITGGTINGSSAGNSISFTPNSSGTVQLTNFVTNSAGTQSSTAQASAAIVAAPVATSLTTSTSSPLYGASISLTPTFSGGTATIGTQGAGSSNVSANATSKTGVTPPAVTGTTTYTLTVTNLANTQATTSVAVTPQTVVVAPIQATDARIPVNDQQTFTSSVSGAVNTAITWSLSSGTIISGQGTNAVVAAASSSPGTMTVTATAAANGTTSQSYNVTVAAGNAFAFVLNQGNTLLSAYELSEATGAMTLVNTANTGANPQQVALSPSGLFAYVLNGGSNTISSYSVNQTSGAITLLNASASATVGNLPIAMAFSLSGKNAYVVNNTDSSIYDYTLDPATGALTYSSPTAEAAGSGPLSINLTPNGMFAYVLNSSGNVAMYSVNQSSGALAALSPATISTGTNPGSLVIAPSGLFLYVGNKNAGSISSYSINQSTGALTNLGTATSVGTTPTALAISETGQYLYVTGTNNAVQTFDINESTGALTAPASALTASTGSGPVTLAITRQGGFGYVANGDNTLSAYSFSSSNGAPTALTGLPANNGTAPKSIALLNTTRAAYSATNVLTQYSVDPTSGVLSPFNVYSATSPLTWIAATRSGKYIYAVGPSSANVYSFANADFRSSYISSLPTVTTDSGPSQVVIHPSDQFVYVVNAGDSTISTYSITLSDGYLTEVGSAVSSGSASNSHAKALAFSPSGAYAYCVNLNDNTVSTFTVNLTTGALTASGAPVATGQGPSAVAVSPNGQYLYVANSYAPSSGSTTNGNSTSIYSIAPLTGALTPLVSSPTSTGDAPYSLAISPSGNDLYVVNYTDESIDAFSLNAASGAISASVGDYYGSANNAGAAYPYFITVSPNGLFAYGVDEGSSLAASFAVNLDTGALSLNATTADGTAPYQLATSY